MARELIKITFVIALVMSGCASPEMVKETSRGGRVVIHGSRSVAAASGEEKAKKMMLAKCPNGYEIIEKGQMATGQAHIPAAGMSTNITETYFEFICK